jgi:hypothetical protein
MRLVVDFIAHKFDINVDAAILDLLDQHVLNLPGRGGLRDWIHAVI